MAITAQTVALDGASRDRGCAESTTDETSKTTVDAAWFDNLPDWIWIPIEDEDLPDFNLS
jgi:hypothetical protein